jgi:hypothetical protein
MESGVIPAEMIARWQAVYGEYLRLAQSPITTRQQAAEMTRLSSTVASAWRDMAATPRLAWWLVAALTHAAEAFERQARDWSASRAGRV